VKKLKLIMRPLFRAVAGTGMILASQTAFAASGITASTLSAPSTGAALGKTSINVGEVNAAAAAAATGPATTANFSSQVLSKKQLFQSSQAVTSIDKAKLNLFNPAASGVQALSLLPGVSVNGYAASSGTARNTISMRGVKVGYNSVPGDLETNGIQALFDGIPLNSLIQGTGWHSTEVPLGVLLSGTNVIYGPGNPRDRWYDSLGGTINFIPVQPTPYPEARVSASYGSDQAQVYSAMASTGSYDGWSAVLATAYAHSNTFRVGPDSLPTRANQVFMKVRKALGNGDFSVGAYWQRDEEFRPNMIPESPIPGITTAGLNQNAPLYSQQTSGFYSDLPMSVWFKNILVENYIAYSRLHLRLSREVRMTDLFWYRHGHLRHYRINTAFTSTGAPTYEYYIPNSETYGNKISFDVKLPYNLVSFGGYAINSNTVNQNKILPFQIIPNLKISGYNTYQNTYISAFLQDRIQPVPKLSIVPGLQLVNYKTQFTSDNAAVAQSYGTTNFTANPSVSDDFVRFAPSVGVNYKILPWLATYGNYSTTYQNPTGGNFDNTQTDLPALKPVKSEDYEVGFRIMKKHILGLRKAYLDVNYYHDYLSHETIGVTLASNPLVTTFGYGSATLNGVNAAFDGEIDHQWSTFANLGLLHGYYNQYFSTSDNLSYNGAPVSDSPYLTLTAGVKYRKYFEGVLLNANLWDQYTGHSYMFNNLTGAPSNQTIPSYNLVNLSLTMRTTVMDRYVPGLKATRLGVYLTNLLGREYNSTAYISSGGYFNGNSAGAVLVNPGSPRTFFVTASFDF
jgi:iron complex outermembrane receptor protein